MYCLYVGRLPCVLKYSWYATLRQTVVWTALCSNTSGKMFCTPVVQLYYECEYEYRYDTINTVVLLTVICSRFLDDALLRPCTDSTGAKCKSPVGIVLTSW